MAWTGCAPAPSLPPACGGRHCGRLTLRRKQTLCGTNGASNWAVFARKDIRLRDGLSMEVVQCSPAENPEDPADSTKTPIVFLHGSYHAAWCWEKFQKFFATRGRESFALSFIGQGESDSRDNGVGGTVASHAQDVAELVSTITEASGRQPVIVGHSFGGLIAMKVLEMAQGKGPNQTSTLSGVALLSSVPPSGNDGIVGRFLASQPIWAVRLSWGFITRGFQSNLNFCREAFFDANMSNYDAKLYQNKIQSSTKQALLDLKQLREDLPMEKIIPQIPILVMAGDADRIVDVPGVEETASFYNTTATILPSIAHDVMLDTQWQLVAEKMNSWLESNIEMN